MRAQLFTSLSQSCVNWLEKLEICDAKSLRAIRNLPPLPNLARLEIRHVWRLISVELMRLDIFVDGSSYAYMVLNSCNYFEGNHFGIFFQWPH